MSNKAILEQATVIFKRDYPGLSAEAIICFLVTMDLGQPTVGDVARAVGMTEPTAYQHLSLLTGSGAGLIVLINTGDGRNQIQLTDKGQAVAAAVNQALAG
ncbi:MAG: helix-turn-helix transcriptional regulator [Alphaproteobacteria bacterium]|nr:helix-turn-helix transcriptional regulator [Alphaproteobacteria bacterium]